MAEPETIDPRKIVYIDEAGIEDTLHRHYARAPRGEQVPADIKGHKTKRISVISGLLGKKLIAPWMFEGYTDAEVFNTWVEQVLLPELPPGYTVILDNASFHKSAKTRELIEGVGCTLFFLPPYSPDFNPIEQWWAILKAKIKATLPDIEKLEHAIENAVLSCLYHKLN